MTAYINKVLEGDCLDLMKNLQDHIVDMVLCDLPYGLTQNKWDSVIDLQQLWTLYERIVKPQGVIALTSQGKFTAQLILSNPLLFKYKIVWIKSKATNFLNVKKQPLRRHEDICIFYRKQPLFQPQKTPGAPYTRGSRKDHQSGNYGKYGTSYIASEDGSRYPTDVLFFEEEDLTDWVYFKTAESEGRFHPTQKPTELARWLIRTFTSPGQLILDNACGSGSFLVAAVLENKNFIGMEKNQHSFHFYNQKVDFIKICEKRVAAARQQMSMTL